MYYDTLILVPAVTFVFTVILKGVIFRIKTGKTNIARAVWSGWMPSVHSAVVVSLTTALSLKYGVSSDYFAIAMAFTVIIIYDAINVRFQAWQHAAEINRSLWEKKFNESLGHLPSEAFVGSIVGVLVALALYFI